MRRGVLMTGKPCRPGSYRPMRRDPQPLRFPFREPAGGGLDFPAERCALAGHGKDPFRPLSGRGAGAAERCGRFEVLGDQFTVENGRWNSAALPGRSRNEAAYGGTVPADIEHARRHQFFGHGIFDFRFDPVPVAFRPNECGCRQLYRGTCRTAACGSDGKTKKRNRAPSKKSFPGGSGKAFYVSQPKEQVTSFRSRPSCL